MNDRLARALRIVDALRGTNARDNWPATEQKILSVLQTAGYATELSPSRSDTGVEFEIMASLGDRIERVGIQVKSSPRHIEEPRFRANLEKMWQSVYDRVLFIALRCGSWPGCDATRRP